MRRRKVIWEARKPELEGDVLHRTFLHPDGRVAHLQFRRDLDVATCEGEAKLAFLSRVYGVNGELVAGSEVRVIRLQMRQAESGGKRIPYFERWCLAEGDTLGKPEDDLLTIHEYRDDGAARHNGFYDCEGDAYELFVEMCQKLKREGWR